MGAEIVEVVEEKAPDSYHSEDEERDGEVDEHLQRLVHGVDPENVYGRFSDVLEDVFEEAGGAGREIGRDGHPFDLQAFLVSLDDRIYDIAEFAGDIELEEGFAVVGPESAHAIRKILSRDEAEDHVADSLETALVPFEVSDLGGPPVSDDDISLSFKDGLHQIRDELSGILVVGIGVDEDIGPVFEGILYPGLEGKSESAVLLEIHDVVEAEAFGHLHGAVGRTVVDDLVLDDLDSWDGFREICKCLGQRELFVFAGDLDDQFHAGARQ